MAVSMETPSRILRRIKALEAQDSDLPSLPSLPQFDDSVLHSTTFSSNRSSRAVDEDGEDEREVQDHPMHASSPRTTGSIDISRMERSRPMQSQQELDQEDIDEGDQSGEEQRDNSPEPSFSSGEQPQSSGFPGTRTPFPKVFSSPPAPLTSSTETPAPVQATTDLSVGVTPISEDNGDLTTPSSRRHSFLLSIVSSTSRPRMALPTPHPNVRHNPTPRLRPHLPTQAWSPSPSHLARRPVSTADRNSSLSPHDRLSFISTASSHDLTIHPRANASFDPVTASKGVTRFNVVKLNSYLHGLNRRLQEENEMLVGRLRLHGEEVELGKVADELEREEFKNVEEAMVNEIKLMRSEMAICKQENTALATERDTLRRRLEIQGAGLAEKPELEGGENIREALMLEVELARDELERSKKENTVLTEEKDALYRKLEVLQGMKDEVDNDLRTEQEERKKDRETWKDRMAEVQNGVEVIVKDLERKLEEAERSARDKHQVEHDARRLEEECIALQDELDAVNFREEKAKSALTSLGVELSGANESAAVHKEEARIANRRASEWERRFRELERKGEVVSATLERLLAERQDDVGQEARARATAEIELDKVKNIVDDLENALKNERSRLRALSVEQKRIGEEKKSAFDDLQKARMELAAFQKSHDEYRHQRELQATEMEKLRLDLAQKERELVRIESEKNKALGDRGNIVKTVATLEFDLRRVRDDAEALGKDLKELKSERDGLEIQHKEELGVADQVQKQLQTQIRVANEQLEVQREKTNRAIADLANHVCDLNPEKVEKLRLQHKDECKGLMVQIRYLKARVTRESLFRADLGYQKHYLLSLLASFETSEDQILAAVARIGFPSQTPPARKRRTLRSIVMATLFITKARRASKDWREQSAPTSAVAAALQEVRRRRIIGSLGYL